MEFTYFIGCDVSKNEWILLSCKVNNCYFREIANNALDIKAFVKELTKLPEFELNKVVFCMEHTGIYNNHLLVYLHKKQAHICLEAATHIKNSLGNIRGKNDKVDSIRIAEYAYKNRDQLRLWHPKREVIQKLAYLAAIRSRLIEARKQLKTPLKEANGFVSKSIVKQALKICQRTLTSLKADLEKVNSAIDDIIKSDEELNRLFTIITSVTGVGSVTATQIIITTNEFKEINDPKKFACYSGVAPFSKESGLFKGKARVSHMANKKVKTLLHMSALVDIQYNEDLKIYFRRKVEDEKKNKMRVINAIRSKLILRIFACVNQNKNMKTIIKD